VATENGKTFSLFLDHGEDVYLINALYNDQARFDERYRDTVERIMRSLHQTES
jgi:hypothetical protein